MRDILLVTKSEQMMKVLGRELCQGIECNLLSHSDGDLPGRLEPSPNFLLVDVSSLSSPTRQVFEFLCRTYPGAFLIALTPSNDPLSISELVEFGADDVIVRPPGDSGSLVTSERIAQKISATNHVLDLQAKLRREMGQSQIVAKSRPLRAIIEKLPSLAESNSTVLISGETGTGKELFARAIHYLGPRSSKPFVTLDCGAIPDNLVENELFGHARGAFTDASGPGGGVIPEADTGTLFLDEVESLPLSVQSKFLRFLQERQYRPIGHSKYISVDIRIVAATNIDLSRMVARKEFREDLYYRLNVVPLSIPPLRDRKSDIPALLDFFVRKYSRDPANPPVVPPQVFSACMLSDWPGNVRELENRVQQWLMDPGSDAWGVSPSVAPPPQIRSLSELRSDALSAAEREFFDRVLKSTGGNLSAAARLVHVNRKTLSGLLKKYGISASRYRQS